MRLSDWSSDVCSSVLVFAVVKVAHVPFIISYAAAPGEGLRSFGITLIIGRDCYPHVAKGKADRFTNATRAARYNCYSGHGNSSPPNARRSEEHTSELQSLMRISYAVFCLKKKKQQTPKHQTLNLITHNTQYLEHIDTSDEKIDQK